MSPWPLGLVVAVIGACAGASGKDSSITTGKAPWVTLNDGRKMPGFGLGTWLGFAGGGGPAKPESTEVQQAVEWAVDSGYRHIDTAHIYSTEGQVGAGLKKKITEGAVGRDDVFITTKLWNDKHAREDVVPALRDSLAALGLDYVELYLVHWPIAQYKNWTYYDVDYLTTWQGMEEALQLGLTRSIGVSNFNEQQLTRLLENCKVKPAVLQIEVNLNLQQPSLRSLCKQHNITVMAYTPFGSLFPSKAAADAPPPRADDVTLVEIAKAHNKTVGQIALRYLVELGTVPIPKSITKSRIEENIDIFDFELSAAEKQELKKFDKHYRTINIKIWESSPYYPFEKTAKASSN